MESYGEFARFSIRKSVLGSQFLENGKAYSKPLPIYLPDEMMDFKPAISFLPLPKNPSQGEKGVSIKNRTKSQPIINLSKVK